MRKKQVAKLLEGKPSGAMRVMAESQEGTSRMEFLRRCMLEKGEVLQVRFQQLPAENVTETVLVEFADGSCLKHTTFVDAKTEMSTISLKIVK